MKRVQQAISSVLICVCFATFGWCQEAQTADVKSGIDKAKVRQLVRQLEDRKRETRDAAEESLRNMGPEVLALLPEIDARTGGELKPRLIRIREHLEKARVELSAKETRVTLKGTMNLSDVLAAIKEQTGNEIIDYRANLNQESPNTEVTVDFDNVPFWDAFDRLLDEANLAVYTFVGEPRKLAIVGAPDGATSRHGKGSYSGLFRIEPTSLTAERNLRNPQADTLRMSVELIWEPRVLPIQVRYDLSDITITTDNDETIEVASTGPRQLPVQPGVASLDIRLPLGLPSRDAKKISSLKGSFTALVPGGDMTFEFDNLKAKNVQQRKGGLTVELDQVRSNNGVHMVYIKMRFGKAETLQSHLDWVENNKIELLDPEGRPADEPNYEKYLERDSEIGYKYIFTPDSEDLKGWKLKYTTPAGIAEIPVEYELKDIILP